MWLHLTSGKPYNVHWKTHVKKGVGVVVQFSLCFSRQNLRWAFLIDMEQ